MNTLLNNFSYARQLLNTNGHTYVHTPSYTACTLSSRTTGVTDLWSVTISVRPRLPHVIYGYSRGSRYNSQVNSNRKLHIALYGQNAYTMNFERSP